MPKKTAREKLHKECDLPKIKPAPEKWGGGLMLIAHPTEFDALMRAVPKGKVITVVQLREALAIRHNADMCCPLTAGIFVNIAAAASEEDHLDGREEITPYWRTLKKDGELNPKYPGGLTQHKALLEAEGHTVIQRRKRLFLADFNSNLHLL